MTLRSRLFVAMVVVLPSVIAISGLRDTHTNLARPNVVEGWAALIGVSEHPVQMLCCGEESEEAGGTEYEIRTAMTRDRSEGSDQEAAWVEIDSASSCVQAGTIQRLRFGVVESEAVGDAPGDTHVVWIECLSPPQDIG